MTPDDHQVDRHHAQEDLSVDGIASTAAYGRAQQPLDHAEASLDLPTLAVDLVGEVILKGSSVMSVDCLGLAVSTGTTTRRGREDTLYVQLLPAETMCRLALVARITDQCPDRLAGHRLSYRLVELAAIGFGTPIHVGRKYQVALGVTDGRQLRIPVFMVSLVPGATLGVVG
jgi:hypothetical protein